MMYLGILFYVGMMCVGLLCFLFVYLRCLVMYIKQFQGMLVFEFYLKFLLFVVLIYNSKGILQDVISTSVLEYMIFIFRLIELSNVWQIVIVGINGSKEEFCVIRIKKN